VKGGHLGPELIVGLGVPSLGDETGTNTDLFQGTPGSAKDLIFDVEANEKAFFGTSAIGEGSGGKAVFSSHCIEFSS
jgi:hypothetical protein